MSVVVFDSSIGVAEAKAPASSRVWAGYQVSHDTFRSVLARWTVPALTCTAASAPDYALVSVGLGKSGGGTETGAESIIMQAERTSGAGCVYNTYIGINGVTEIQLDPGVGDSVVTSVRYVSGRYRFTWTDLTDASRSWQRSLACTVYCSRTSAEIVVGLPQPGSSPLADYHQVAFRAIAVTDAHGRKGSLAHSTHWTTSRFDQYDRTYSSASGPAASSSTPSAKGTAFTDTWHHK
ncbi:MAG TPA: G1 family glutamic endopeptidase [Mycobacteriales bacterium]|nr:G1 family glutamic endopeptidase [Mycobacteriales bacterium]